MYGIELWYITNIRQGKEYYFKGIDRGRRLWTTRKPDSMFYTSEADAHAAWNQIGKVGQVSDGEYV